MTDMNFRRRPGIFAAAFVMGLLVISAGSPPVPAATDEAPAMTSAKAEKILARIQPRAENGSANAQYNLGVMYANGYGVEQSWVKARHWYLKAAEQNHAKAEQNLGVIYAKGEGVQVNKDESAKWFLGAARDGSTAAQNNLAVLYAHGAGVDQDIDKAAIWAARAARGGNSQAEYNLPQIVARLPKRHVTGDNVKMRSEPDDGAHVETLLDRGKRVARLASREHWTQVLLADTRQIGWVKSSKLEVQSSDDRQKDGSEDQHAREAHDESADESNGGGRGHLVSGAAAERVVAADSVNVHTRPARGAPVKFHVNSGTHITVTRAWKGWMLATFPDGRKGWVAGFLLGGGVADKSAGGNRGDTGSSASVERVVAADGVNVHTQPARSAPVKFQVDAGKHLTVKRTSNGWILGAFPNGSEGWIAGFLLK